MDAPFAATLDLASPSRRPVADVARELLQLAAFMRAMSIDLLVGDRLCRLAGLSAHLAGVPHAAFGTDGDAWKRRTDGSMVRGHATGPRTRLLARSLGRGLSGYDPRALGSDWLVSPRLNLALRSRGFWSNRGDVRFDPWTHFLGLAGAPDGSAPAPRLDVIVITLGTTYPVATRDLIIQCLPSIAGAFPGTLRVLTGEDSLTARVVADRALPDRIEVKTWEDYDRAFAGAKLAIGHGGDGFLHAALYHAVPMLVLLPGQGNQLFNARQIARLGLGRVRGRGQLGAERLAKDIQDLTTDLRIRQAVEKFRAVLLRGGGVEAAVRLLERLAFERRPVTSCALPACCVE